MRKINKLRENSLPRSNDGDQFLSKFFEGLEQILAFFEEKFKFECYWVRDALEKSSIFVITFAL